MAVFSTCEVRVVSAKSILGGKMTAGWEICGAQEHLEG